MRRQLVQHAIHQILGEARGADAADRPEAWVRAQEILADLVQKTPTDEELARLAGHDGVDVDHVTQRAERRAA